MRFEDLDIHPKILHAITDCDFTEMTPVQAAAIPVLLTRVDARISAQTGTGKTAAFLIPSLDLIAKAPQKGRGPRVLILEPTRELAVQVAAEADRFSKHLPSLKTICLYGGVPYPVQYRALARHHDILVATPGRLLDHLNQGKVFLEDIELCILDEADRMLDMGFIQDVTRIFKAVGQKHQTVVVSATLQGQIQGLMKSFLSDPIDVVVAEDATTRALIEQKLCFVNDLHHKYEVLSHFLKTTDIQQAIIFTATKRLADHLTSLMQEQGYNTAALHGDKSQRQRLKTLDRLRNGSLQLLVATDVAARGIDIPAVSHIFNFDIPNSKEDYVHRIGRTGRAGASGVAILFVAKKEKSMVRQIEGFIGQPIAVHTIEELESLPRASMNTMPDERSDQRGSRRGRDRMSSHADNMGRRTGQERQERRSPRRRSFERDSDTENREFSQQEGVENISADTNTYTKSSPRQRERSSLPGNDFSQRTGQERQGRRASRSEAGDREFAREERSGNIDSDTNTYRKNSQRQKERSFAHADRYTQRSHTGPEEKQYHRRSFTRQSINPEESEFAHEEIAMPSPAFDDRMSKRPERQGSSSFTREKRSGYRREEQVGAYPRVRRDEGAKKPFVRKEPRQVNDAVQGEHLAGEKRSFRPKREYGDSFPEKSFRFGPRRSGDTMNGDQKDRRFGFPSRKPKSGPLSEGVSAKRRPRFSDNNNTFRAPRKKESQDS